MTGLLRALAFCWLGLLGLAAPALAADAPLLHPMFQDRAIDRDRPVALEHGMVLEHRVQQGRIGGKGRRCEPE